MAPDLVTYRSRHLQAPVVEWRKVTVQVRHHPRDASGQAPLGDRWRRESPSSPSQRGLGRLISGAKCRRSTAGDAPQRNLG